MSTEPRDSATSEERRRRRPLDNISCIYCGQILNADNTTKEHVVGRRFVPLGALNESWNLIANACRDCNLTKSNLENDISALTMQPTPFGEFASEDPVLRSEAERKGQNAISRRTGKPVSESQERMTIVTPFLNGKITFEATSSPQIDRERAFALAGAHVGAFFYFITYNWSTNRGGFCQGAFHPVEVSKQGDWGSDLNRSFMTTVNSWASRVQFVGASGFFKLAIRRHPSAACWSWAVEWNRNVRVVGFMGDSAAVAQVAGTLKKNETTNFASGSDVYKFRTETALPEADDTLFQPSDPKSP